LKRIGQNTDFDGGDIVKALIDLKKETKDQKRLADLLRNRDWLSKNFKELQVKYSEKWVAITDEKIAAFGDNVESVKKETESIQSEHGVLFIRIPQGQISKPL
jgi:hypothetical protein